MAALAVRFHGRGGQGVVTAAELLSVAAFLDGRTALAFPSFGSERMGAPVESYCRITSGAIRTREPVAHPDAVVIIDATLLHHVTVFAGLAADATVLVNSARSVAELGLEDVVAAGPGRRVLTVPATEYAREHIGRPVPNVCLLGALVAATGCVSRDSLDAAVRRRFGAATAAANIAAAGAAWQYVRSALPEADVPSGARRPSMRDQVEGSRAVAVAVARCRPAVVPAYPITPQTHIVEALGTMIRVGALAAAEYVTVESEFAAMSAAIGASAAGARTYTATASQGLLYMTEAVFNAAGLGLPIVMTVANRAIGAPINIWNDHSDAMSQRDCGWVQLYATDNQEAVDLHVLAFRLAEAVSVPVMVCMDGFVLTHAFEPVDLPEQGVVDRFLPPFRPRQVLDPAAPVVIGAMVGPDAYTEVRYLADQRLRAALPAFDDVAREWEALTGRRCAALRPTRTEGARVTVVAMGSLVGTLREATDAMPGVGVVDLTMFRPFPAGELRRALAGTGHVVVIERALAPGSGGVLTADVRAALAGTATTLATVVAGLGGRPVTSASLRDMVQRALEGRLGGTEYLDLRTDVVDRELRREALSGGSR